MERIKAAIEKAKKSQADKSVSKTQSKVSAAIVLSAEKNELDDVSYTSTRIAEMDSAHLERNRIIAFNKNDHASWAIDSIRTQVLQAMEENGWRTIAVVSPTPESGKSVISINLAISIAQQSQWSAMLVDFDLRRPRVGSYLGLKMDKSLNDYLEGVADIPDILVNPQLPRLVILPTAHSVKKSSETLSSKKIEGLINELRNKYTSRIVIFDLPPVLTSDDVIAVLPKIDCALLVIGNGMSSKSDIEETMHLMGSTNIVGVVLNKAEVQTNNYYYE